MEAPRPGWRSDYVRRHARLQCGAVRERLCDARAARSVRRGGTPWDRLMSAGSEVTDRVAALCEDGSESDQARAEAKMALVGLNQRRVLAAWAAQLGRSTASTSASSSVAAGALSLVRLYMSADELLAECHGTSPPPEAEVRDEIDTLAGRLRSRLVQAEQSTPGEVDGATAEPAAYLTLTSPSPSPPGGRSGGKPAAYDAVAVVRELSALLFTEEGFGGNMATTITPTLCRPCYERARVSNLALGSRRRLCEGRCSST